MEITDMKMGLSTWLEVDHDQRDSDWERRFLNALPHSHVRIANPEPQAGPDHWPYLLVESADAKIGGDDDSLEPVVNILHWLSGRGIGFALNTMKPLPDYILTYGMVWNFKERGEFLTTQTSENRRTSATLDAPSSGRFELKDGQKVWAGPPSETYLPKYVRTIIKQFFMDQGVFAPKVLMVSTDEKNYDLCFSIESLKSPPAHEHANIVEALAWFLPAHYAVSLLSEKTVTGFVPL